MILLQDILPMVHGKMVYFQRKGIFCGKGFKGESCYDIIKCFLDKVLCPEQKRLIITCDVLMIC